MRIVVLQAQDIAGDLGGHVRVAVPVSPDPRSERQWTGARGEQRAVLGGAVGKVGQQIGQRLFGESGQVVDGVVRHPTADRCAPAVEVWHQVGEGRQVQHGARQRVRAGRAALLEHGNRQRVAAPLLLQLRQPQGRRQPGRAGADDQHVDLENLALLHGQPIISAEAAGRRVSIGRRSPIVALLC